jgi:hypothetical protein
MYQACPSLACDALLGSAREVCTLAYLWSMMVDKEEPGESKTVSVALSKLLWAERHRVAFLLRAEALAWTSDSIGKNCSRSGTIGKEARILHVTWQVFASQSARDA